jgi:hypothetical protein
MALKQIMFRAVGGERVSWQMEAAGDEIADISLLISIINALSACNGGRQPGGGEDAPAPPGKKENAARGPKDKYFTIAATSPDDELYELAHSGGLSGHSGGRYRVYRVHSDGSMHFFDDPDFKPQNSKEAAIAEFRRWAAAKGYEIMGDPEVFP